MFQLYIFSYDSETFVFHLKIFTVMIVNVPSLQSTDLYLDYFY